MSRKEITKYLSELIENHINPNRDTRVYWAKEVTFDYGLSETVRVDYMQFIPVNNMISGIEKGDFYCYEVKSSVEDFHSKNGHNFLGDYNYYVMPLDVYESVKEEIGYYIGVYTLVDDKLKCIKKAHRHNRNRSTLEMLFMMFRSSNRELIKLLNS